jgi:hypothetical protein
LEQKEQLCKYYSELFFKMLLKKAYRKVNLKDIKITHNISDTGVLNIIATDGHYSYDMYIHKLEYKSKSIEVFEISRYSEFSTYSNTKIFNQVTLEEIK